MPWISGAHTGMHLAARVLNEDFGSALVIRVSRQCGAYNLCYGKRKINVLAIPLSEGVRLQMTGLCVKCKSYLFNVFLELSKAQ